MNRLFLTVILLGYIFLGRCSFPPDYVDLMKLPEIQRHEAFRKLPIEKQVDFYLLRADYSHPFDTSFADDIAILGDEVTPYLLERLKKESIDYRKRFIIFVFEQIHRNTIDLRGEKEVIDSLEHTVNQIEDSEWRRMSQKSVQFIKNAAPKYAPDYNPSKEPPPLPPPPPKPQI